MKLCTKRGLRPVVMSRMSYKTKDLPVRVRSCTNPNDGDPQLRGDRLAQGRRNALQEDNISAGRLEPLGVVNHELRSVHLAPLHARAVRLVH